jgi:hypothetical protein
MNTDKYIIDKLKSNKYVANLLDTMEEEGHTCYVAGGAMTAIATGKHDEIADYDIYFSDVDSAVAAIRYMKEENPQVSFISDKSITYVMNVTTKIQFIYYAFYPEATDIFKHFDFTVNMMAYSNTDDKLYTHENFWMHNSQRYLHINKDTFYPIISNLRVQKYIDKGYHTSRSEIVKLSLAIANLKIDTWVEAKAQMGNSYGYTLADFKKYENTEFSMGRLFELLENGKDENSVLSVDECYLYPVDTVDFVLLNKPIEVMEINGREYYVDKYAEDCNGLEDLIEEGVLAQVNVGADKVLNQKYYLVTNTLYSSLGDKVKSSWNTDKVYTKERLPSYSDKKFIYEVEIEEQEISHYCSEYLTVNGFKPIKLLCRGGDVFKLKQGSDVEYKENATMLHPQSLTLKGWAMTTTEQEQRERIAWIRTSRHEHLNKHILIESKSPNYGKNTWSGLVVKGGEDITAEEILLYMDDYNTCFGGNIVLRQDGTFSGTYYTD